MTRPSRGCNATPVPRSIFVNTSICPRTEAEPVADKLTQQILDALGRVAAEPTGLPLYAGKTDAGLFPNAASARPAAQKCLADDLVRVVSTDATGKAARDLYVLSEKGWEFLLAAVNPKQVLEDFVRVLESRRGEVGELLSTASRMADSLQGLKDAVSRVLPGVSSAKVPLSFPSPLAGEGVGASPTGEGWRLDGVTSHPSPVSQSLATLSRKGRGEENTGVALVDAPLDLAPAVVAYLADHAGPTDCPLPELFRALSLTESLTIGAFHDCLRQLHADGTVSLPAWTGPLYALPEPQYALLIGHGIAYYASLKG